jgi:hypothetical protein
LKIWAVTLLPLQLKARADRQAGLEWTPAGDEGGRLVVLVAEHLGAVDPHELPELLRDRREHLGRCCAARGELGDAPQGCLFLG